MHNLVVFRCRHNVLEFLACHGTVFKVGPEACYDDGDAEYIGQDVRDEQTICLVGVSIYRLRYVYEDGPFVADTGAC